MEDTEEILSGAVGDSRDRGNKITEARYLSDSINGASMAEVEGDLWDDVGHCDGIDKLLEGARHLYRWLLTAVGKEIISRYFMNSLDFL